MTCTPGNSLCDNAYQVWELPVDGRPARQLPADDPRSHWTSTRSPDGTRVAYVADDGLPAFGEAALVVAAADGSQPRELFSGATGKLAWSPTGDRIAFLADDGWELRVVDVASGATTTLVQGYGPLGRSVLEFSPEGDRILFARGEVASSLLSVDASGSEPPLQLVSGVHVATGDWQAR